MKKVICAVLAVLALFSVLVAVATFESGLMGFAPLLIITAVSVLVEVIALKNL